MACWLPGHWEGNLPWGCAQYPFILLLFFSPIFLFFLQYCTFYVDQGLSMLYVLRQSGYIFVILVIYRSSFFPPSWAFHHSPSSCIIVQLYFNHPTFVAHYPSHHCNHSSSPSFFIIIILNYLNRKIIQHIPNNKKANNIESLNLTGSDLLWLFIIGYGLEV